MNNNRNDIDYYKDFLLEYGLLEGVDFKVLSTDTYTKCNKKYGIIIMTCEATEIAHDICDSFACFNDRYEVVISNDNKHWLLEVIDMYITNK